jgi:hypothetical protein
MFRVFAIVLVAWFAALTAEPIALHPCPMHDGMLAMHSGAAMQHQMGAAAMGHGASMSEMATPQQMPPSQPMQHHQCTCLGACTATSAAGLPSAHLTLAAAIVAVPYDPGLPDYVYVPVAAQHVLPFAHGPPQQA